MILLITGCINVDSKTPYVSINNTIDRLTAYNETIEWAIKKTKFKKVVFCENSNYHFDVSYFNNLAQKNNKQFEYLTFQGNKEKVISYGKGYGEGEITEYFIHNSKLLKSEDYFYKITGRLTIINIDNLLRMKPGNIFVNKHLNGQVDTRFYCVSKDVYNKYLISSYKKVSDLNGYYLEHAIFDNLSNVKYKCFKTQPLFRGVSGSTGKVYNDRKNFLNNLLCFFNLYNNRFFWKIKRCIANLLHYRKKN